MVVATLSTPPSVVVSSSSKYLPTMHPAQLNILGLCAWLCGLPRLPRTLLLGSWVNNPCATLRAPDLARSRAHLGSGLFNECSRGCRLRHVDRMAARGLLDGCTRSLRHRALGGRGDRPFFSCSLVDPVHF